MCNEFIAAQRLFISFSCISCFPADGLSELSSCFNEFLKPELHVKQSRGCKLIFLKCFCVSLHMTQCKWRRSLICVVCQCYNLKLTQCYTENLLWLTEIVTVSFYYLQTHWSLCRKPTEFMNSFCLGSQCFVLVSEGKQHVLKAAVKANRSHFLASFQTLESCLCIIIGHLEMSPYSNSLETVCPSAEDFLDFYLSCFSLDTRLKDLF